MAAELADIDGIRVKQVIGNDDVASSVVGEEHKRRGVAGIFFVYKAAGAAAAEGLSLDEVARIADKARLNTRTMGVALSSCVVPEVGHATFSIGEDEMEIGMGIHGEPGISRKKLAPADQVVDEMMERIFAEQPLTTGDEVAVLVNGLGGTPTEELYILFRRVSQLIEGRGAKVKHVWIGEFATAMEMAGASISVLALDAELDRLVAAPAHTPFFTPRLGVRGRPWTRSDPRKSSAFSRPGAMSSREQREFLIALDGKVGDSDLGITMSKSFAAAYDAVVAEGARRVSPSCCAPPVRPWRRPRPRPWAR